MPRVANPKPTAKKPAAKKNKLYAMPEAIPMGEILTDISKNQWKIGPSIGTGGFGEIYTACRLPSKLKPENYDCVVKCEPHGNGPLFVEMHFYMRNAKPEDIQRFKKTHQIKSLGMPHMIASGSHELNGKKHRFIVMPRYGKDIMKFFLENARKIPEHTIYRIAIQMIDVYQFIHSCGYVHADLKGANILLGFGKTGASQTYLVDFGLASHYTTKDFKPDPKKMHNGTIEYTSRDAHQGVATMRADFEILGYNMIEWSGVQLPWVRDNLLSNPAKVQKAKEEFMSAVTENISKLYSRGPPAPLVEYMKLVEKLKYNETPDYQKFRKIFLDALKSMKIPNSGDLDFKLRAKLPYQATLQNSDETNYTNDSDSAFENPPKNKNIANKPKEKAAASANKFKETPVKKVKKEKVSSSSEDDEASANSVGINFSPVVRLNRGEGKQQSGKTIINDDTKNSTAKTKLKSGEDGKTYEINLEIGVSFDTNIVLNVKRKKKNPGEVSSSTSSITLNGQESPVTRVKVRKIDTEETTPSKEDSKKKDSKSKAKRQRK